MILMRARTTVRLPETLMREVKRLAVESDRTITEVIEEALRDLLTRRHAEPDQRRVRLPTDGSGGMRPGVDLADRATFLDIMDSDGDPA
jgi:Arc/MetJ-type ribon-helix-helix transcriptional regulator